MIISISFKNKIHHFDVHPYLSIGSLKLLFLSKFEASHKNIENLVFINDSNKISDNEIVKNYYKKIIQTYLLQKGGSNYQIPGNQKSLCIFIALLYTFFGNKGFNKMIGKLLYPNIDDICDFMVSKEQLSKKSKPPEDVKWWKNNSIVSNFCDNSYTEGYFVDKAQKGPLYILSYVVYMAFFLFAVVFGLVIGSFTKTSCGKPGGGFIGLSILFIIIFMIIPVIVPFIPKIIDWFRKIFKIKEVVNNNNNNNNNRPKNGYPTILISTILISTIFIAVIGLIYLLINVKQFTPWIWLWMFVLGIVFLVLRWFSSLLIKLVIIISNFVMGRYYKLDKDSWQCSAIGNLFYYLLYTIIGTIIIYYLMNILYGQQFNFACKNS
jgi:hypothetical protein